jgi:actin-related protein
VVNEHNQTDTPLKFLERNEEIKNSDTKKVKFKKEVVLFKPKKNSKLNEATDNRNTKKRLSNKAQKIPHRNNLCNNNIRLFNGY